MRLTKILAISLCLATWLIESVALAQECPVIAPNNQPRLEIPLFEYAGANEGEAKNQFSRFQAIIKIKLTALIDEIQWPARRTIDASVGTSGPRLSYLNGLRIYLPGGSPIPDTLTTPGKRYTYWKNTNSLELLRGTLWPGTPYFVDSEIYIGELRGNFPRREVRVRLPVEPELVPTTNDTHSLVTYYALAMNARKLECDPGVINHFLSLAWSILKDLKGRPAGLQGDLTSFETILKEELELSE